VLDLSIEESLEFEEDDGVGGVLVAAEIADAMGLPIGPADSVGDRGQQ